MRVGLEARAYELTIQTNGSYIVDERKFVAPENLIIIEPIRAPSRRILVSQPPRAQAFCEFVSFVT
jgi:hypothetical protein